MTSKEIFMTAMTVDMIVSQFILVSDSFQASIIPCSKCKVQVLTIFMIPIELNQAFISLFLEVLRSCDCSLEVTVFVPATHLKYHPFREKIPRPGVLRKIR